MQKLKFANVFALLYDLIKLNAFMTPFMNALMFNESLIYLSDYFNFSKNLYQFIKFGPKNLLHNLSIFYLFTT
jgi:hypothetical protein